MRSIEVSNPSSPEPGRRGPVRTFASAREAKEYLIDWIVVEARRLGVSLSEVERKMLYASRAGWAPPDMDEVQDAFDRYHDAVEYELKMTNLIRLVRLDLASAGPDEIDTWNQAVRTLGSEDHYLLQMIVASEGPRRRLTSRWKIWLGAIVLFAAALAIAYWASHRGR